MSTYINTLSLEMLEKLLFAVFAFFSILWFLQYVGIIQNPTIAAVYSSTYGMTSFFGIFAGLKVSKFWGGFTSVLGKSLLFFSIGLGLQEFGQLNYSALIYIFNQPDIYPSIGDLGYFGSIPCYIIGTYYLGVATGFKFNLNSLSSIVISVFSFSLVMFFSWYHFLQDYPWLELSSFGSVELSVYISNFLAVGYPVGQALYVLLAVILLLNNTHTLGGKLLEPSLFLVLALITQYFSDFTFLYQNYAGTWVVNGINDYLYLVSYALMSYTLIKFGHAYSTIKFKKSNG
jgi:hypothetical protein